MEDLTITAQELQALLNAEKEGTEKEKILLLDVRREDEFNFCKISGSVNVPLTLLMESLHKIDQDRPIITVCHHGVRSMKAAIMLKELGFSQVKSLHGGIDTWSKDIDSFIQRY